MLRKTLVLILVVCMVTTPLAGVVGAVPSNSADQQTTESLTTDVDLLSVGVNTDEEFNTDIDDLAIWERSVLSLRADLSTAETAVDVPDLFINTPDVTDRSIDRNEVGVFEADGEDVTIELRDIGDARTSEYDGENITVILGQADPDQSPDVSDFSGLNLLTSFDQNELDNLNNNATFNEVESTTLSLDEDGSVEFDIDDPDAGQYVVLVAANEDNDLGLRVDEGELTEPDNSGSTIIGAEGFVVQDSSSDVTHPDSVEPGDDITFDANTDLSETDDVGHIVAVYDESVFLDDLFRLTTDEEINSDLSEEDFTIEHPIEDVNGVANLEDDIDNFGVQLMSDRVVGPQSLQDIILFAADELDQDSPELEATGETTLDASVTAQVDSNDGEITVETLDSWAEGDYRFIHIASENSSSQFATTEGTINIEEEEEEDEPPTTGGSGGSGGASPVDDDDDDVADDDDTPDAEDLPPETPSVEDVRADLDQTEPNTQSSTPIVDNAPDRPGVTVNPEETESVREITFSDDESSGNVDISEWQDPPESVSQSVSGSVAAQVEADAESNIEASASVPTVADIDPDSDEVRGSSATVQMTVEADRLDDPEDATIAHERGDSWETLETTVTETEDGEVTLEAETESFSLFAVAEVQTEEQDEPVDDVEDPDDGAGTTGLIGLLVVLALIVVAAVAYRQMNSGDSNNGL